MGGGATAGVAGVSDPPVRAAEGCGRPLNIATSSEIPKNPPPIASATVRAFERTGTPVAPHASAVALTVTVPSVGGSCRNSEGAGMVARTIGADVLVSEGKRGRMTRETRSADTRAEADPKAWLRRSA